MVRLHGENTAETPSLFWIKINASPIQRWGTIEFQARNVEYPSQTYVYEGGGTFLNQDNTWLIREKPNLIDVKGPYPVLGWSQACDWTSGVFENTVTRNDSLVLKEGNSSGLHETEWINLENVVNWGSLKTDVEIGKNEKITMKIQVSQDGNNVDNSVSITLENGINTYKDNLPAPENHQYVRIVSLLENDNSSHRLKINSYELKYRGTYSKMSWELKEDWEKGYFKNTETSDNLVKLSNGYTSGKYSTSWKTMKWRMGWENLIADVTIDSNEEIKAEIKGASPPETPVSWWTFDDEDAHSDYRDDFWNGNQGQTYGTQRSDEGVINNGENFELGDEFIVPDDDSLDIENNITIAFWAQFDNLSRSVTLARKESAYTLRTLGDELRFELSGKWEDNSNYANLEENRWMFIAVTYDNKYLKFYRDDSEAGTKYRTGKIPTSAGDFMIENFDGLIDEFMIFDEALSQNEIELLYRRTRGADLDDVKDDRIRDRLGDFQLNSGTSKYGIDELDPHKYVQITSDLDSDSGTTSPQIENYHIEAIPLTVVKFNKKIIRGKETWESFTGSVPLNLFTSSKTVNTVRADNFDINIREGIHHSRNQIWAEYLEEVVKDLKDRNYLAEKTDDLGISIEGLRDLKNDVYQYIQTQEINTSIR